MFANTFGDYLIRTGKLSESQFLTIKAEQAKTRVKLGLIAVSEKMITEKQADEINRKQAVMDKRFGDIAVELGYLTNDQVARLLSLQGNPYMLFTQTASDLGILSVEETEQAMRSFQKEYGFSNSDMDAVKSGDIDRMVPLFLPVLPDYTKELAAVALRTINRLITTDICIYKASIEENYSSEGAAMQRMSGDTTLVTAISGSREGILVIADTYAGENFEKVDLDALDSVGEFINIVNGLYATALSTQNVHVELMPPVFAEGKTSLQSENGFCRVPLLLNRKPVDLIVNSGADIAL